MPPSDLPPAEVLGVADAPVDAPRYARDDDTLGMIGTSEAMRELRRTIFRLAPIPAAVLVTGETGVGKELVARALHQASGRTGPFVAINAGAISGSLIASELFGHVRGAFTGATCMHRGVFEQAHGGTLLLDEVRELPIDLQAWLLRVLETGEVRALGAERTKRVDVRVIAATNVDLAAAVTARRFRHDLYYRLCVLEVEVPPLRHRLEDIAALAAHVLYRLGPSHRLGVDALQALTLHPWPGNVRELRSVLTRAAALADGGTIDAIDVMRALGGRFTPRTGDALTQVLVAADGNVSAVARALGISRSTVRARLRRAASPMAH